MDLDILDFLILRANESKNLDEKEMHESILSLYTLGLIEATWNEHQDDLLFTITEAGKNQHLINVANTYSPAES